MEFMEFVSSGLNPENGRKLLLTLVLVVVVILVR
jgi:hypothetical protein